jgi:hypothetical protein
MMCGPARKYAEGRKKAQFSEMLAFIFLVVFVTFFIIFIRLSTVPTLAGTVNAAVEAHENKYLRAGTNVIFFSTETASGKPLMELLGLAAYAGNRTVDMGRHIGKIDVGKEIEKRMDAVFGKGKWYMEADFPELTPEFQIVVVADTSGSMCNDVADLSENLPNILQELKKAGRKAQVTVYLLPSPSGCCLGSQPVTISCTGLGFPDTEEFNCETINNPQKLQCSLPEGTSIQTSEDWGDGLACAVQHGPRGGWKEGAIKIGIPLSDELSLGSECGCTPSSCQSGLGSLEEAITQCQLNGVKAFPLRAYPCGMVCYPGAGQNCNNPRCSDMSNYRHCPCGETMLVDWMKRLAEETGGEAYNLSNSGDTAEKINEIVKSIEVERVSYIQLGTPLDAPRSLGKRIRSWDFVIPVSYSGKYTTVRVYSWQ